MISRSSRDTTMVWRMSLIYVAIFGCSGLNQPYMPVWLAARGLSEPEIAVIVGLPFFMRLLVTPAVGRIADRVEDRRNLIRFFAMASFVLGFALWNASGFWPILLFYVLMMMPMQNLPPVFDASALDLVRRGVVQDFGRLRLWGSAGYALASVLGGYVLAYGGTSAIFIALLTAILTLVLASLALPPGEARPRQVKADEKSVLRRPAAIAVVMAGALVLGSQAVWNGFGSIHLRELGVPDRFIGLFWALATASELLMFWAGPILARHLGPFGVLVLAACGGVLRWLVMASDPGPIVTALAQLLHAATFGCAHLGVMSFFAAVVSSRRGASAQADFVTATSLVLGTVTMLSGPLYKHFASGAYLFAASLPLAALLLLWTFRHRIAAELADAPGSPATGA